MGGMRPSYDYDIRVGPSERTVRFQEGKLFLGGLDESITTRDINEYCSQWGEVTDSVVMDAKNYGFVTFRDPACAMSFLETRDHVIRGRRVDAKAAVPKHLGGNARLTRKLFVGGTKNLRTEEFVEHFARFGKIEDAVIVHREGVSRGFGFVTFSDEISVEKCLVVSHIISGKKVELKRAIPKEEMEAAEQAAAAAKAAAAAAAAQAAAYGAAAAVGGGYSPPPPGAGFFPGGGAGGYVAGPAGGHPGGGYSPVPVQFAAGSPQTRGGAPPRGGAAGGSGGHEAYSGGGGGAQGAPQHPHGAYGWPGPAYFPYGGHPAYFSAAYGGYAVPMPYGMGYAPVHGGWQQQAEHQQQQRQGGDGPRNARGGGGGTSAAAGVAALQQQLGQLQVAGAAGRGGAATHPAARLPEHLQHSPLRQGDEAEVGVDESEAGHASSEELGDEHLRDQRRGEPGGNGAGGKPQPAALEAEAPPRA